MIIKDLYLILFPLVDGKNAGPLGNKEGPDQKPHQAIKPPERIPRRLQLL